MPSVSWGVDSYHIAVGAGDAAIHLLIRNPDDHNASIFRAILVDGGDGDHGIAKNVQWTMHSIAAKYKSTLKDKPLKFDAIVITHWDHDHYEGIVNLIAADIATQKTPDTKNYQISFMKYDGAGRTKPLTTLYAPYWESPGSGVGYNGYPTCFREDPKGKLTYKPTTKVKDQYHAICNLRYDDLRGTNFFDNSPLPSMVQLEDITSPSVLYDENKPKDERAAVDTNMPGCYCVGSNELSFKEPEEGSKRSRLESRRLGIVDERGTTGTNLASIFAMVIWQGGHLSHYFAGDADWDMEKDVVDWSKTNGDPDWTGGAITSVKLSHHGARKSTPMIMLHNYMPKNVIVSCGKMYGHPCWEIMVYLEALYRSKGKRPNNPKPIYSTSYPGWLAKTNGVYKSIFNVSTRALTTSSGKSKWGRYVEAMRGMYDDINKNTTGSKFYSIFAEWDALRKKKPKKDAAKQWVCTRMQTRWEKLSPITADQLSASSAGWKGPNMVPNSVNKYLRYIKVKSRKYHDPKDGEMKLQYHGDQEEVLPPKPVTKTGKQLATANKRKSKKNDMTKSQPLKKLKTGYNLRSAGANVGKKYNQGKPSDSNELDTESETDSESDDDNSDTLDMEGDFDSAINPTTSATTGSGDADGDDGGDDDDDGNSDDNTYYMYGTDNNGELDPGSYVLGAGDLDDFVNLLHRCVIGLASAPSENTPTIAFGDNDEWYCWLQDSIQVTALTATATASNINAFSIVMTSPADTAAQPPPAKPSPQLKFGTAFAESALGLQSLKGDIPGYVTDVGMMAFGLDPSSFGLTAPPTTLNMTLLQVFDYCGLSRMTDSFVMKFLGVVNLELDPSGSAGKRNAVWFDPTTDYRTVVRLQFDMPAEDLDRFNGLFAKILEHLTLDNVVVVAKRASMWDLSSDGALVQTEGDVVLIAQWTYKRIIFDIAVEFREEVVKIEIKTEAGNALEAIIGWVKDSCKGGDLNFINDWLKRADADTVPNLRRITLTLSFPGDGAPTLTHLIMDVEVALRFGNVSGEKVVFLLSLDWDVAAGIDGVELKGTLWCASPSPPDALQFLPDYEPYLRFAPITTGTISDSLNLENLFGTSATISYRPPVFLSYIVQAYITLTSSKISFGGMLGSIPPKRAPTLSPGTMELEASLEWVGKDTKATLSLEVGLLLEPSKDTTANYRIPASLWGKVAYDNGAWTVAGSVQNLYASALYSFFDTAAQNGGVMSFLERIEIKHLDLTYTYKRADGDEFTFAGNILVGDLQLTLTYKYDPGTWTFHAVINADVTGKSTVGAVVDSIVGGAASKMPSFVANIPVSSSDHIEFWCRKPTDSNSMLYSGTIKISDFQLSYAQYRGASWTATTPPKRIIKATMAGLQTCHFPVVGDLEQPFDEIYYLWVEDTSDQNVNTGPGLLQSEVAAINNELSSLGDVLLVKPLSNKPPGSKDLVIAAGSHFVVVLKEKDKKTAVIDYVFGQPKKEAESTDMATAERTVTFQRGGDGDDSGGDSGPSMAAYKKSIGPLSITNIGFQLKGSTLSVLFDATFALGPLSLTLIGFGLGLNFAEKKDTNLFNLPTVVPSLSGLAVSFNRPPLVISGLFEHNSSPDGDIYIGGVIVAFDPYLFEAAGFYGKMAGLDKKHPKKKEITACIFGLLAGPLVELEFAEISGITGGFGYNSALRYPSVSEVMTFPFIDMTAAPADPMDALTKMMGHPGAWFTTQDSSYWVAAGLKVTAFETLVIDAVVVVQWDPSVSLGIFGVAAADIPADPDIKEKFARVELGIAATVNFAAGVMKFEAQLMPSSFVLSPDCHLTGGFALYYWFEGSDPAMQGDWVFTIGGFNKAFHPPSQYPNPPRLAISWNLDDSLSITGQAYFAITPKVCMGGGLLHASLSLGPLQAFFDAYADFLINYKPFHFIADAGISVGVRYTLDLWIVTLHISVEIGAHIYLQGPPMSGRVHVDFWVFGFDINFGPGAYPCAAVNLLEFYKLVYQAGIQPSAAVGSRSGAPAALIMGIDTAVAETSEESTEGMDGSADQKPHIFSCQTGQIPSTNGSKIPTDDVPWLVRAAALSFGIACRMAIDTADIKGDPKAKVPTPPNKIYAKPMQLTVALTSDLEIEITPPLPPGSVNLWRITQSLKAVPSALWGVYDPNQDPSNPDASDLSTLLNGGTPAIILMMGVTISAPFPTASKDRIPPFNAALESSEAISPDGTFPAVTPQSSDWLPLPGTGGNDQWDLVKAKWQDPLSGKGSAQEMVTNWATLFGWEAPALNGGAPGKLLGAFGNLYMDAPLLSVSSTGKSAEMVTV